MAVSVSILAIVTSLHLIAFVLAIGAESRRSSAKVVPDKYDEQTYCVYESDASTVYGLVAFGLLLISQAVLHGVTRCLCFGKGLATGTSNTTCAILFFIVSWISFLGAEACLLAGSARNAYHTKYRTTFHGGEQLSCATLRKGVFAAGAALTLLSLLGSVLYYWTHSRADTGGWEKHRNEGLGMTASDFPQPLQQRANEFEKFDSLKIKSSGSGVSGFASKIKLFDPQKVQEILGGIKDTLNKERIECDSRSHIYLVSLLSPADLNHCTPRNQ